MQQPITEGRIRRRINGPLRLTRRQREAARLLSEGRTYSDIARRMGTSKRTTEAHLVAVRHKLGVETSFQLAIKIARGEIDLGSD
jgi:DNA-binding CsgD family transcriptional regulator